MGQPRIRAYANCDDALVVWAYDGPIRGSRGFALYRRFREEVGHGDERTPGEEKIEPVYTFTPFSGQPAADGEGRPSTEWPIQRFMWIDVFVRAGFTQVSYRAVPLLRDGAGTALREDEARATPWSRPIDVTPQATDELSAYFNRGIVATQAIVRRLRGKQPWKHRLSTMIASPGDGTRNYLAGPLRDGLFALLDRVRLDDHMTIYAALFELNDPELLGYLRGIGDRAHVVLANGAGEGADENGPARVTLISAKVDVRNRLVQSGLAHNKFLVVCEDGKPVSVWTGSTNWTMTGLCTQVNNALLIANANAAGYYLEQWHRLADAGSAYPDALKSENATRKEAQLARQGSVATWFTPLRGGADLDDARDLIARAREGLLFLMFNPGARDTLFHAIMARTHPADPTFDPDLYVHGVLNQDPNAKDVDRSEFKLIQRGRVHPADPAIVMPAAIDRRFGHWERELTGYNIVMVHSKVIVIDPFGENPYVLTGSHNLGTAASEDNDDNLVIVKCEPALAAAYATNIKAVYDAYRWRYVRSSDARAAGHDWDGPVDDDGWQQGYFEGPDGEARRRELRFWLGAGRR
jgi:hypothetical protein